MELDEYGHSIAKRVAYMEGCFLKKAADSANGQIFKISRESFLKKCLAPVCQLHGIKERFNTEKH